MPDQNLNIDPVTGIQGQTQTNVPLESQEDFMYDDGVEGLEDLNVVPKDAPAVEDSSSASDDIDVPLENYDSYDSVSLDDVGGDEMSIRGIENREAFSVQERDALEDIKEKFGGDYYFTDNAQSTFEQLGDRQSAGEQFLRASGRIIPNAFLELVGNIGSMLDVPDYFNSDDEVGNWLTDWANEQKEDFTNNMAVYQKKPGETFQWGDFGWWADNGSNLVSSAAAFIAMGYGLGQGLQALKWLNSLRRGTGMGLKASEKLGNLGNSFTSAAIMNQAESVGIATDVYDKALQKAIAAGKTNAEAVDIAAKSATYALNLNKSNIFLNMTSAGKFLRAPKTGSQIVKELGFKGALKETVREGGQEYLEENMNLISEKEGAALADALIDGKDHDFSFKNAIDVVASSEGREAGFWGFLGGAIQNSGTSLANEVKLKTRNVKDENGNTVYKTTGEKAFIPKESYVSLKSKKDNGETITQEDIDEVVKNNPKITEDGKKRLEQAFLKEETAVESLEESEPETERYSSNQVRRETARKKKKFENEVIDNLSDKGQGLFDLVNNADALGRTMKDIDILDAISEPSVYNNPIKKRAFIEKLLDNAKGIVDSKKRTQRLKEISALQTASKEDLSKKRKELTDKLLEDKFYMAAENDAIHSLTNVFEGIQYLSEEEAIEKGFDPKTYREDAAKAVEEIKKMSKQYDKNKGLYSVPVEKALFERTRRAERTKQEYESANEAATAREAEIEQKIAILGESSRALYKPELTKINKDLSEKKENYLKAEQALTEVDTKEGKAKIEREAENKYLSEYEEVYEEAVHKERLSQLESLNAGNNFILELDGQQGNLKYNPEKGYHEFLIEGKDPIAVSREISKKLADTWNSSEFVERNQQRLIKSARLEAKLKAIQNLKEVKDKKLKEVEQQIEESTQKLKERETKLEELQVAEEIVLEQLAEEGVIPEEGIEIPLPSGRIYNVTADGKVFNNKGEELTKDSNIKKGVLKRFADQQEEFKQAVADRLQESAEMLSEIEEDVSVIEENLNNLTAVQETLYESLILMEEKDDILMDADEDFITMWSDAQEELENSWSKEKIQETAERLEFRKNNIQEKVNEIKEVIQKLYDLAKQNPYDAEVIELDKQLPGYQTALEGYNTELKNLQKLFQELDERQVPKEELQAYSDLLVELSMFYSKVQDDIIKEQEKVKETLDDNNTPGYGRTGYQKFEEITEETKEEGEEQAKYKKISANTSAGNHVKAIKENDEDSKRWFEALNKIPADGGDYFIQFVTYDSAFEESKYDDIFTPEEIEYEADYKSKDKKRLKAKLLNEGKTEEEAEKQSTEKASFYNGIKMVLINKDGSIVKSDKFGNIGKGELPLSMSIHNPVTGDKVAYKGKDGNWETGLAVNPLFVSHFGFKYSPAQIGYALDITEEDLEDGKESSIKGYEKLTGQELKNKVLEQIHNEMMEVRNDIKKANAEKGKEAITSIVKISGGHMVKDAPTEDGSPKQKDIVGTFVKDKKEIQSVKANFRGNVVITDKKGQSITALPVTLDDKKVNTVLEILDQSLNREDASKIGYGIPLFKQGKDNKYSKNDKLQDVFYTKGMKGYPLIESFLYWGKAQSGKSAEYQIYFDKNAQSIFYGEDSFVKFEDIKTDKAFREFISNKKLNYNKTTAKKVGKDGTFYTVEFSDKGKLLQKSHKPASKTVNGYDSYMLDNLKTDMKEAEDGSPSFLQKHVQFNPTISDNVKDAEDIMFKENMEEEVEETSTQEPVKSKVTVEPAAPPIVNEPTGEIPTFSMAQGGITYGDPAQGGVSGITSVEPGAVPVESGTPVPITPSGTVDAETVFMDDASKEAEETTKDSARNRNTAEETTNVPVDDPPFKLMPEVMSKLQNFINENASELEAKGVSLDTTSLMNTYIRSGIKNIDTFLDLYSKQLKC